MALTSSYLPAIHAKTLQNFQISAAATQGAWQPQQSGQQENASQAGSNSVSMELMAKLQRQKEAKEKAELAEQRRREAQLAAERAEEEYKQAMEAERQATEAASGSIHSPNLPEILMHISSIILHRN
jgi:hypothetical protein